ncbi:MAG: Gfo/Idh/MocA family oxidoreductase [Verrucomicrobiota bacterium]|nr:Gfo/Idh/MocA family oxidoreductase [Verrucomicrobiota bacterium]
MKKLKVGIVGLGMGSCHIEDFRKHPNVEVVALADISEEKLKKVGTEKKVKKLYTRFEEMLEKEDLDIVTIAVPNFLHKPFTIAAFEAGCHVICEKPMAMNAQEAEEMIAVGNKFKKKLMINFSYRFSPEAYAMKKEVDNRILGKIYYARTIWHRRRGFPGFGGWFGQKKLSGGGPLIDLGVHRLDLALWLMGYPEPKWVMGSTYNHLGKKAAEKDGKEYDVEDIAVALIKFKNGATIEIEASCAANIKENEKMETRLLGTKGGMFQKNVNEGYSFELNIYEEHNSCQYDRKLHPPIPDAHNAMYHFADSILNNTLHTARGEEGLIVMKLLDAIYESAKQGRPIEIK